MGLVVGQAVTIKRGVEVAVRVEVAVVVGQAVMTYRGVDVIEAVRVSVVVVVPDAVIVAVAVNVSVVVTEAVCVGVPVRVPVCVDVEVGGRAEGLTEAASLPTVISTPQTSGRVSVAE